MAPPRAATPLYGLEVAVGIEQPYDGAIGARIGAQSSVEAGAQHGAGNGGRGASLSGAASLAGILQAELGLRGLFPDGLAVRCVYRVHAAGCGCQQVGRANEEALAVDGDAPLSAQAAALAEAVLPGDLALFIRVEGVHQARLLRGYEQIATFHNAPGRAMRKNRSRGPSSLGHAGLPGFFGRQPMANRPGPATCFIPANRAGFQVHRDDGVGARLWRVGIAVAVPTYNEPRRGSIVGEDQIPPPEGPKSCTPALFFPRWHGFGHRVSLPGHLAGVDIEGDDGCRGRVQQA